MDKQQASTIRGLATIWFWEPADGWKQLIVTGTNRDKRGSQTNWKFGTLDTDCPRLCCGRTRASIERWIRPEVRNKTRNRSIIAELDDGVVGMCRTVDRC